MRSLLLILLTAAPAQAANLIENPSFTTWGAAQQAFQHWQPNPSATVGPVAAPTSPPYAASLSARSSAMAGVRQDVRADLLAIGSGHAMMARVQIQVAQPATVRCSIELSDSQGTHLIVLAERTVHDTGTWTRVEGARPVTWSGTLNAARLVFDVSRPAEGGWPDVVLDDVVLDLDDDRDLLPASAELTAGTTDADPDFDDDGLPDGWEDRYSLNPAVAEALNPPADLDQDGWSNLEEFAAATEPDDNTSVPATPADPYLAPAAQVILDLLTRGPAQREERVLVGQHISFPLSEYDPMFKALGVQTDHTPAVLALQYDDLSITPLTPVHTAVANAYALAHASAGGIVEIKWSPLNPWTGGHYGQHGAEIDLVELITPGTAVNDTWMSWLDEVGAGLQELEDDGVTVLWRPMSEMNGAWFWWGRRPRQEYVDVWRHMFDHFRDTWKLHNLLWVYESASAVHALTPADYYYPGDDYVDVMGHNLYDDDWVLPSDMNQIFRSYPKVYAFPQAGPGTVLGGSFDNRVMIDGIRTSFPRAAYFSAWNTFLTSNYAIIDNDYAQQLMDDLWIRSLEELP
jgi:mannan endo-1,4-beta-mannosidase